VNAASDLKILAEEIVACRKCPRLVKHREKMAREKRRAFREWTYWGKPVPGFGDAEAQLLILGLAPAAHGANRTGRMFTGDRSGAWLYGELYRQGLASAPLSVHRDDGLTLRGAYIAAAARCAPPDNKPTLREMDHCREYLVREMAALAGVRVRLLLGRVAFDAFLKSRRELGLPDITPRPVFGHGVAAALPEGGHLLGSYHPSQQNTSTGKLTGAMWRGVFDKARALV
jgi:uracil-DNA glycosylase family 4